MRPGLTPKMAECLEVVARLTVDNVPPTYDQIAQAMNISSKSGVLRMLTELKERGYVDWHPDRWRSLYIVGANADAYTPAALHALTDAQLRDLANRVEAEIAGRAG